MSKQRSAGIRVMVALLFGLLSRQGRAATVAEQYLLSAINHERVLQRLAPLRLDAALVAAATRHARMMVEHHGISHGFAGEADLSTRGSAAGAHFDRITENVAEGRTAVILHDALMHSAGHRANILDPKVDAVGIAVIASGGQLYVVEDFEATVRSLNLEQQEGAVGILLERAGLELVPDVSVRTACDTTSGYSGEQQPTFIVRYTTGDLQTLPEQLTKRLALKREHRASVGACERGGAGAFSGYNLAVVLLP